LSNINLKNITEQLIDTFFEAGKIAKKISDEGIKITIKEDKSPVTDGDLAVDKILREKIKKITPQIPIISEETVKISDKIENKNFWLIDPIDGTKEYIKKKDEYTLNAALILNLRPEIGIVYAPAKNRLFFSHGKGSAYEIRDKKTMRLNCEKKNKEKIIGLENSSTTPDEILNIYKDHKVSEKIIMSSSLKFCVLAAGEADIYAAQARAYEWDIAAGHAILEHAGGTVTTHDKKKIFYGKDDYKNLPLIAKRAEKLNK